jgi:hypothetical protein
MSTISKTWSQTCTGRKFLVDQFSLYKQSEGKEGIDPSLRNKQDILEVFAKHPEVSGYKEGRFPINFRDTAAAFRINETKDRARKQGKSYFIPLFIYLLYYN